MSTKSAPIFASSFLRQSSLLHNSIIEDDSKTPITKQYHWYNTNNTECVTFPSTNDDIITQTEWLQLLSSISTRFIQVSWRILHDLQIAPPSHTNHLQNHDEWVMVEISYNNLKTISCVQTIQKDYDDIKSQSNTNNPSISSISSISLINDDSNPLIKLSPLIINDLHLQYSFNTNHLSLITLNNININKIGMKSIDFHNFPIAKIVRFQVISSLLYDIETDYNNIVEKYMLENKINDIELMKDDYYLHHKCIWNTQIVAIPIIDSDVFLDDDEKKQIPENGIAALEQFYARKQKLNVNNDIEYNVKHWLYIKIVDIINDNEQKEQKEEEIKQEIIENMDEYFRILPAVTKFIQVKMNANSVQPRLCEYFTSVLLHSNERIDGDSLYYNYRIPVFYDKILQNKLFSNIYYNYAQDCILNVNPTFLIIANKGHRLGQHLQHMCKILGVNYTYKNCVDLIGANMSKTVELMNNFLHSCIEYEPLILHLDCLHLFEFEANIHSFYNNSGKIKPILPITNVFNEFIISNNNRNKIIIFGESSNISKITRELRAIFTYEYIIDSQFDDDGKCDTEIIPMSLEPYLSDLTLINGFNTTQLFELIHTHQSSLNNNVEESYQDIVDNIRWRQSLYNVNININVSSIPTTKWEDIGGLEKAKREIYNVIELPIKYKHVFASIKQSCGILLHGPPGTGKTLLAKAIATEYRMNFISIKGPELLNPYVGQSEANIREVFSKAVTCKPCILFFDEIDALVPARGRGTDGGNVMDRIVSQLLTEIDVVSSSYNGEIFIIAATNRPDLLDAALLRPKRLDKQIYLGIPDRVEDKLKIIIALTRKFKFNETDKLKKMDILNIIANKKEIEGFTGADLYALCCDAMMCRLKLLIAEIESLIDMNDISVDLFLELVQNKERNVLRDKYNINIRDEQWNRIKNFDVKLDLAHFEKALLNLKPSLSKQQIMRYQSIHRSQGVK